MTRITYTAPDGDPVGYSDDGIYYTERTASLPSGQPKHFFVKFHGYGISLTILRQLWVNGVKFVYMTEVLKDGTRKYWMSYLDSWFNLSERWRDDNDEQRILNMRFMWPEDGDPPEVVTKQREKTVSTFQEKLD